jgi:hypothetical protein
MQQHSRTIKLDREQRKRAAAKLERKRARHEVKDYGSGTQPRFDPVAPTR